MYTTSLPTFETELSRNMVELRLENGSARFLSGTSNLIYPDPADESDGAVGPDAYQQQEEPLMRIYKQLPSISCLYAKNLNEIYPLHIQWS